MAEKMSKAQAGQLGGLATVRRYGPEYMRAIGKRGAAELHRRYHIWPYQLSKYALVNRETGEVKATW